MVAVGADRNGEGVWVLCVFRVIPGTVAVVDVLDFERQTLYLKALAAGLVGGLGSVDYAVSDAFVHQRPAQSTNIPSVEFG